MQESIRKNNIESNKLIERLKKQEGHEAAQTENVSRIEEKIKELEKMEREVVKRVNDKKVEH